ncbi:MAG: hypothetical protein MJ246_02240 [Clostridia bacterium]|nr:hypothetical protein [Clostridia bacterium]
MVKNKNIKIVTDFATINLIKTGISADNKNITVGALSDYDRMSFLLDGENELKERILITEDDPKEVQKLMLIDYLAWYLEKVEVEGTTQDEQKADIIKSLKDAIKLYDTEKELKTEKAKFDTAISNGTSYDDVMKVYNLVHPLNDEQKTLMNADYDKLLIYSYVKVETLNINDQTKQADAKKSQSKDFIQDEVIFNKILKSSEKLTDEEKEYITKNYLNLQDLAIKDKVLERILLYLSDEKISGTSQNENKEIILRDIYNGI